MTTRTAIFQGTINIPLFKTGYTVAKPTGYIGGLTSGAAINPHGDTPCIFYDNSYNTNAGTYSPYTINAGSVTALNYDRSFTATIGAGLQHGYGSNTKVSFSYFYNLLNYSFSWPVLTDANNSHVESVVGVSQYAFASDTQLGTIQPSYSGIFQGDTAVIYVSTSGFIYTNQATDQPCLPAVASWLDNSNVTVACSAQVVWNQFGQSGISVVQPHAMLGTGLFSIFPSGVQSNTFWTSSTNCPNIQQNRNVLFGFNATGHQIAYVDWSVMPTDTVTGTVTFNDSGALTFDSNSNLNAQITKYNVITCCAPCGVKGFLAVDIDSGIDYFVNWEGTKYWRLNYVPQGTAPQPVTPSSSEKSYKFIDQNGIFWYTGSSVQSGNTVQPLFSLGFNIPYAVYTLMGTPPFRMPCYEDCLGAGSPLTKI